MTQSLPPGFVILDDVVPQCDLIIDWLESSRDFEQSKTDIDVVSEKRTSNTAWVRLLDFVNPPFVHEMNRVVWSELDNYAKQYDFHFNDIENVSVQRYEIGQQYELHSDASTLMPRIVSAVAYLNTVDDGGETYFPHFDVKIKPIAGRLAIFPSCFVYCHAALAPISGVKYAAAYWAR